MTSSANKIILKSLYSSCIHRENARNLFKFVNSLSNDGVIIDFSGITEVSRSFIHEYMSQKKASKKEIKEINVHKNISKMISLLTLPKQNLRFDPNEWESIELSI